MLTPKLASIFLVVWINLLSFVLCHANNVELFGSGVNPHVLIVLDVSDSMKLNVAGETTLDESTFRLTYAKDAIYVILNADTSNSDIDAADSQKLKIEFGYMRFQKCNPNNLDACIEVRDEIGSSYSDIWSHVKSENISGLQSGFTPIAAALEKAKNYFEQYNHSAKACAEKYVILVTDGNDTLSCDGMRGIEASHAEHQKDQYKRRRASVAAAKSLAEAGIKVFVVGFSGGLNSLQKRTLNWMAYYGGTDNPIENAPISLNKSEPTGFYSPVADSCAGGTTLNVDIVPGAPDGCNGTSPHCFAKSNDPGSIPLEGYAFTTDDVASLTAVLKKIVGAIQAGDFSFTSPLVPSVRATDDDKFIYTASFEPQQESFWPGHLRKYPIGDNGVIGNAIWDAGEVLQKKHNISGSRSIYTCKEGEVVPFSAEAMTPLLMGTIAVDDVVGYIRGEEAAYNPHAQRKLGDIFHSTLVMIGRPSTFFNDFLDKKVDADGRRAFDLFREDKSRRAKIIYAGANDGQLHAFNAEDGSERWSFIPPNLLSRLKEIQHKDDPDTESLGHQFFVDGAISAADIWVPDVGNASGGSSKDKSEWNTYLILGEGRGGEQTLWSKNASCEYEFSASYKDNYPFYCGFYALDVTEPTGPHLKWILHPNAADAPYFGQPWGKPVIGRVMDGNKEIWVAFLGGGFNGGHGVFSFKMSNGEILWRKAGQADMAHDLVAAPLLVDTDQDGFIDRVYAADLGGNVWRLKLCKKGEACTHASWEGQLLFKGSGSEKIFSSLTAARDKNGRLWIYWGTGDRSDPSAVANVPDRIYAVQDDDTSTFALQSLGTSDQYKVNQKLYNGWYYVFTARGEKMISDPLMLNKVLYFTTYVPADTMGADACFKVGYSNFYAMNFTTGEGTLAHGARYKNVGTGMASSAVVSMTKTGSDAFIARTHSNGKPDDRVPLSHSEALITTILYWRDKRIK